tara:strand:+ start:1962 stop:2216 length:255 start_codon:yes stop_codon:yes gene_type:complete
MAIFGSLYWIVHQKLLSPVFFGSWNLVVRTLTQRAHGEITFERADCFNHSKTPPLVSLLFVFQDLELHTENIILLWAPQERQST